MNGNRKNFPNAMHELPFGAQMTERLFQLAQKPPPPELRGGHEVLPCIQWAPQSMAVPGKAGWMLTWRNKNHMDGASVQCRRSFYWHLKRSRASRAGSGI